MFDGRLIAIPPTGRMDPAELVRACRAAAAGGATALQVRMKRRPACELLAVTEAVMEAVTIPVYVNDRADVAAVAGAAGVHIGSDDLPAGGVRRAAPRPLAIGLSVGTDDEAIRAVGLDVDYWSCGPFYATGSKRDAGSPIGVDGFRRLAQRAPGMRIVAIGGITAERIGPVIEAGADGVAAIGALFDSDDVERATRRLRDALDAALP